MKKLDPTMASRSRRRSALSQQRADRYAPKAVTVVLSETRWSSRARAVAR